MKILCPLHNTEMICVNFKLHTECHCIKNFCSWVHYNTNKITSFNSHYNTPASMYNVVISSYINQTLLFKERIELIRLNHQISNAIHIQPSGHILGVKELIDRLKFLKAFS